MPDIMHRLNIGSSRETVFAAISTAEGVRNWRVRNADLEQRVGGTGEFRFAHYGPEHTHRVLVRTLREPSRVEWEVIASFFPAWIGTRIVFDLQEEAYGTTLSFLHSGFPEADDLYAMCNTGWAYYLVRVQQYAETGKGMPSPDVDFSRMLR